MPNRPPEQDRSLTSTHGVTRLLDQWGAGKPETLEELLPMVHGELRFLGCLNSRETGKILDVAVATVERDWRDARLWLCRRFSS